MIVNRLCFVTTKSIADKQIQHNCIVSSSFNYSKNWCFIKAILHWVIIQFEKNVIAYKNFFFNFKSRKDNSNNLFFFESFVSKTNRFRFVFSDSLHQNESKIKKRQLQTSFYSKFIDNIFRDISILRVNFVIIQNIELNNSNQFNNFDINRHSNNQSIDQQTFKQNINNFINFIFTFDNIDMINNWQNIDFFQQQWTVLQKLICEIIANFNSFESSNFSKFQSTSSSQNTSIDNDNNDNRWNVDEIDFFDSLYDDKSTAIVEFIEYIDKNTYFRNVTYFIERVKNIIEVKNVELIRQNFYTCFRDIALT